MTCYRPRVLLLLTFRVFCFGRTGALARAIWWTTATAFAPLSTSFAVRWRRVTRTPQRPRRRRRYFTPGTLPRVHFIDFPRAIILLLWIIIRIIFMHFNILNARFKFSHRPPDIDFSHNFALGTFKNININHIWCHASNIIMIITREKHINVNKLFNHCNQYNMNNESHIIMFYHRMAQ